MDVPATVTTKGQVTIPAAVRRALRLQPGTRVIFHLEPEGVTVENPSVTPRASLRTYPDLLALAGAVPVPPEFRSASWKEIRAQARASRAQRPPATG
jgi:antitoxin PrlF